MEPLDHILRPCLPWRSNARFTECGLNPDSVKTLTRDEYAARIKDMGVQRASLFTCMTCAQTAERYSDWGDDPRQGLAREIEWEGRYSRRKKREQLLVDELTAIAALVLNHREEFDSHLAEIRARREWNARKKAGRQSDG